MDKNAIKKYAVWARRELIERISQRAMIYGITAKDAGDPNAESVNGHLLSQTEKRQRQALIRNIKTKGYEQVMEEVAYTWFNRFAALRFMEVNGYLPSHIRVFTNDAGEFKPQILAEAIHLELAGLDMKKVYALESANKSEELFKYLLIVQCNALNSILPGMFQKLDDYTVLLLPDYLLREGSVIEQMVTSIPEADWTDQVQIIGWLYQFYNIEPKAAVFAKSGKIIKEEIPAATQLFTPDWIVHYMVDNSLGRMWLESHPNDALKSEWKYYQDDAKQESAVLEQLDAIRKEYTTLKPEQICVIDPCMGSGHILCVLFDSLVQIYEDYGFSAREAAGKIVENNLWGLDIDERAAQLAYFSVMMKARQYDRRFFTRGVQPNVYAIQESNNLDPYGVEYYVDGNKKIKKEIETLIKELYDAKEYGSLIKISGVDFDALNERNKEVLNETDINLFSNTVIDTIVPFIQAAFVLSRKYHVVVTNPPYLNNGSMSQNMDRFVKRNYPDGKTDLYAAFMKRCGEFTEDNYFFSMITQHSWMFLTRFEKLRDHLLRTYSLEHMAHLGARAFDEIGGEVVQTTTFVFRKSILGRSSKVVRLVEYQSEDEKRQHYFSDEHTIFDTANFLKIPGFMFAYWLSEETISAFERHPTISQYADAKVGLQTSDNNRFLRFWHEVGMENIGFGYEDRESANKSGVKWFPYNKGGSYRKWYGNNEYVVNWQFDGKEIREYNNYLNSSRSSNIGIANTEYYFKEGMTWSALSTSNISVRYTPVGFIFDSKGSSCFADDHAQNVKILGYLNSKVATEFLKVIAPTLDFSPGSIARVPYINTVPDSVVDIVERCIEIARMDWDQYETSWDFKRSPLVCGNQHIRTAFEEWKKKCIAAYHELKRNEEKLNQEFIALYGMEGRISPEVDSNDIALSIPNIKEAIKNLISYAVGCMFGRYSLDTEGIVFTGGKWNDNYYQSFKPDNDAIIPICDDEYFEDDIVGRFVSFISIAFGAETLEENLRYIADALGGKGSSREIIRSYFLNDFYTDHLKVYQKRPIYWLFDSGKKNGFKCLVYMHRYQPDTIARIRTDYVHEQQSRYRTAIADLEQRINGTSTSERVKLSKQLTTLQGQSEEIRVYEEKIHHLADQMIRIDLDDGVKHNYEIFKDVLAKLK